MNQAYHRSKQYSESKLGQLRQTLQSCVPANTAVLTFGSYARREASEQSDIDYVVVNDEIAAEEPQMEIIEQRIAAIVKTEPSSGGAFAKKVARADMLRNLGGQNDTNHTLTRRLLLLLEGEWLANETSFRSLRRELLERYVGATKRDHQLALFLLNDIIRYWRTMTVDYMYKTTEDTKPWAIRNIKLIFSRKLMYTSGLFSVAMTIDRSEMAKVDLLERLFDLPVIDRMIEICGESRMNRALESYDLFLSRLEDAKVRSELKAVEPENHGNASFRELKNEGHRFTRELLCVYESTFHKTHPIHRAVLF